MNWSVNSLSLKMVRFAVNILWFIEEVLISCRRGLKNLEVGLQ